MASKYLITNKEFLEFVQAEGYQRKEFWTDEGWKWKEFCKACHPLFWVCDKGMYELNMINIFHVYCLILAKYLITVVSLLVRSVTHSERL